MNLQNTHFLSVQQVQEQLINQPRKPQPALTAQGQTFLEILGEQQRQADNEVKFSKHATMRLADRGINLTGDQLGRLSEGTQKAGEKGIQNSLVIVDQMSFIVNTRNNTVVTALGGQEAQGNIFTNIDGAVII